MLVFTVYFLRLLDDFPLAFLLFLAAFFFPLLLFLADFLLLFPPNLAAFSMEKDPPPGIIF